ncbi:MAG: hypothetical protein WHZ52_03070 [Armatimonadota bacterium]
MKKLLLCVLAVSLVLCAAVAGAQTLFDGRVTPLVGLSQTNYTFSVKWQGTNATDGPSSVWVELSDGQNTEQFTMSRVTPGTPDYRIPQEYRVITRLDTYFDQSLAKNGLQIKFYARQGMMVLEHIPDPPVGPFQNDPPILLDGGFSPRDTIPTTTENDIRLSDPVTYTVTYRDINNEAPADGYPIAWVGNVGGWQFNGGVISSIEYQVTLITATPPPGETWQPSQFRGQPLTWSSGKRNSITDTIIDNTSTMLIVRGKLDSNAATAPVVGDRFAIGNSSGQVTAIDFTAAAFIDTTKNYAVNSLLSGRSRLQIVAGSGIGRAFAVAANTAQTIAISGALLPDVSPDPELTGKTLFGDVLSGDCYSIDDYLVGEVTVIPETSTQPYGLRFNNSPGWTPDQFAGLVAQAQTGTAADPRKTSFTILRNTEDTLYFAQAAPVFDVSGVATGDLFRIAGLHLQANTSPTTDYAQFSGVTYRNTVPGLGAGRHTLAFVAANSPEVNSVRTTYQTWLTFPPESQGPLVVPGPAGGGISAAIPAGNSAPLLRNYFVTPAIGTTASTYTFSVDYLDPDGDPPGPHDGVEGYIKLFVEGPNGTRTFQRSTDPLNPGAFWPRPINVNNPADPAWRTINASVFPGFSFAPGTLAPGSYRFHFEASDGWRVVRVPANPENDPVLVVNSRPVLTIPAAGGVVPAQGNTGTTFRFQVIYSDLDNQAPASINLRLTKDGVPQLLPMTQADPSDTNYADGALFEYVTDTPAKKLTAGTYSFRFEASDGIQSAAPTFEQTGPTVRSTNRAPVLLNGAVSPESSALQGNSFTFSVRYRDADGDVPEFVRVTIFEPNGTSIRETLTLRQADPADTTFSDSDGVLYVSDPYTFDASGQYFHRFSASDGLAAATGDTARKSGPRVNTPPQLSGGVVTPTEGLSSELFTFSVVYTDADGAAPGAGGYVRVVLTRGVTVTRLDMQPQGTDYVSGVEYRLQTQLPAGIYTYRFEASDGLDAAADTPELSGPTVTAAPEVREARVTPAVGRSTDQFTYSAVVANPDGTPPAEVVVIIDGAHDAPGIPMLRSNPADNNFTAGVRYEYTTTLSPGPHTWYIRARVGGETVFPAGQTPDTPGQGPVVNEPPMLTAASVTPTFGRPQGSSSPTTFVFEVRYSDADNVAPGPGGFVRLRISALAAEIPMVRVSDPPDWQGGVVYRASTQLPGGRHSFYFEASDGIETVRLPSTGAFDGPRVSSPPTLTPLALQPGLTGTTVTTFTYSVVYRDPDNDPPAEGSVKVLIDGQPYTMTKQNPAAVDYVQGVTYVYSTRLSRGTHNYLFQASDGVDLVSTAVFDGPTVTASGVTVNASPNPAALGSQVTISGQLIPAASGTVVITLVRPGGVSRTVSVATASDGRYSTSVTVDEVGEWTVTVVQQGVPANTATLSPPLTVQPATLRVQGGVVDMISVPITTPTGDPAAIFGSEAAAALNIVRWDPATSSYKFYGSAIDFPVLTGGSGFWIRPASTRTLTLTGTLPDQTQSVAVAVLPGWNQIGSGFVGPVDWPSTLVQVSGQAPVTLAEASARGWVRDYAWGYDPVARGYFLVRGTGGATRLLQPFRGYWLRAFVPCTLLMQPPAAQ